MKSVRLLLATLCLAATMSPGAAAAVPQGLLLQLYGRGVHAYHAGDYFEAIAQLSGAIDAGSGDPRCYYFRGLARLATGQRLAAEDDFVQGARIEAIDTSGSYDVGPALERVQGADRILVERHRARGHAQVEAQRRAARQRRFESLGIVDDGVVGPPQTPTLNLPPVGAPSTPNEQPAPSDAPSEPAEPEGEIAAPTGEEMPLEEAGSEELPGPEQPSLPADTPAEPDSPPPDTASAPDDAFADPASDDEPADEPSIEQPTFDEPEMPEDSPPADDPFAGEDPLGDLPAPDLSPE